MPYRDEDEDEIVSKEERRKYISELEKKQNDDLNKLHQELLSAADSFDNGFDDFINSKSREIRSGMERYHKIEEKEQTDYENFVANFKRNKTEDEQIDWLIKIATSNDSAPGFYSYLAYDENFLKETIIKLTSEEFYKKFINKMNLVKEDEYKKIIAEIYPDNKEIIDLMISEIIAKDTPLNKTKDFLLNDLVNDEVAALTMSFILDITKINCIKSKVQNSGEYDAKREVLRSIKYFFDLYNRSSMNEKSKIIAFLNLASKEIYYLNNIDITKILTSEHPDINKLTSDLSNIDLSSKTTIEFTEVYPRERSTSFIASLASFSNKYYKDNTKIKDLLNEIKEINEKDYNNITATDMKVGKLYHIEDPVSSFMSNLIDFATSFSNLNSQFNDSQKKQLSEINQSINNCRDEFIKYNKKSKLGKKLTAKRYKELNENIKKYISRRDDLIKEIYYQIYSDKTKNLIDIYKNANNVQQMEILEEVSTFREKILKKYRAFTKNYTDEEIEAAMKYITEGKIPIVLSSNLSSDNHSKDVMVKVAEVYGLKNLSEQSTFIAFANAYGFILKYCVMLDTMNEHKSNLANANLNLWFEKHFKQHINQASLEIIGNNVLLATLEYLDESKNKSIEFSDMYSNFKDKIVIASNNIEKGISK